MPHINDPLLQAYIDGFCNDERVAEIESHVEACDDCRGRLESARGAARRASELLGSLDPGPVHAPAFAELEARAAARRQSDGDEVGGGGRIETPGARPRVTSVVPLWRRPALAWVATLVVAFGLGWLSRAPTQLSTDSNAPASASRDAFESRVAVAEREEAGEVAAREGFEAEDELAAVDDLQAAAKSTLSADTEADAAGAEPPAAADPAQTPPSMAAGPTGTPPAAVGEPEPRRRQLAQNQASPADAREQQRVAGQAQVAATPPAEEVAQRPVPAQPAPIGELNEVGGRAATFADAGASAGFVEITAEDAELWLGVPPRQLPDLSLVRVEVGPGALALNRIPGRAAVRLVYVDAAGQQITLLQQYTGALGDRASALGDEVAAGVAGAASGADASVRAERARVAESELRRADAKARTDRDAVVGGALDLPAIVQQPGGPTTYRWLDAGGYVLAITGDLDPQALRGLADRVR
jgi:anti-sigma factor RsiW